MKNETDIRFANIDDGPHIRQFLDKYWKKNYALVESEALFDWQFLDKRRKRYNFVLGVLGNEIRAIYGFMPISQFDDNFEDSHCCWATLWMVIDAARGQRLGQRLVRFLLVNVRPNFFGVIGISDIGMSLYKKMGFYPGVMWQYYILNPTLSEFSLVKLPHEFPARYDVSYGTSLVPATEDDVRSMPAIQCDVPYKTPTYLINRYFRHPVYKYQAYFIRYRSGIVGIVMTRICNYNGINAVRIVDFSGHFHALRGLKADWERLIISYNAEYIDFIQAGVPHKDLILSGFAECTDGVIIPTYFEPFVKEQISINYITNTPGAHCIFKGDADQDRPNTL